MAIEINDLLSVEKKEIQISGITNIPLIKGDKGDKGEKGDRGEKRRVKYLKYWYSRKRRRSFFIYNWRNSKSNIKFSITKRR